MNQVEKETIISIHRLAFCDEEGNEIAKLAKDFLTLPATISISVMHDERIVRDVLYHAIQ